MSYQTFEVYIDDDHPEVDLVVLTWFRDLSPVQRLHVLFAARYALKSVEGALSVIPMGHSVEAKIEIRETTPRTVYERMKQEEAEQPEPRIITVKHVDRNGNEIE